ncbi:MAG: hypothetical protein HKN56_02405 [Gammaproteobacteria bacterium]|nr:hypothetical protein [Gammaproteobacteria bacterium]NND53804.1 hypothetical protein [Gammaproteobacteria bacterium]
MKCLYYLAPTLKETHQISEDLHEAGVNDWFLHVVSKDEAGLKKEQLHSSNYLETLDLVRDGVIGANIGFIAGVIGAFLLMFFEPFGPDVVPAYVYLIIIAVATLFGAWEGGLFGVDNENQKLKRFHDDIEAGKYLLLIYARRDQDEVIKGMMASKHPEAVHVATDRHFVNPFAVVRRKRGTRRTPAAS